MKMCESSVYIVDKDGERLVLENVELVEADDEAITLIDLFGEKKQIKGRVKSLSLVDHKIFVEPLP